MSRTTGRAQAQSYVELHKVRRVQFGFLKSDEVARMSVVKIDCDRIYNDRGLPNLNAINDPRMGTMDKELKCLTCMGTQEECPGHFGHIELVKPVYHGGLIEFIRKILRCVCFQCSRLLLSPEKRKDIEKIRSHTSRFSRTTKECDSVKECLQEFGGCGLVKPRYTKNGLGIDIEYADDRVQNANADRKQKLMPEQALKILEGMSDQDCELLGLKPSISRPENMIIKNLAVAPPPVRPNVIMSSSNRSEDDLTYSYQKILQTNLQLKNHYDRGAAENVLADIRRELQYYVATLMDNEIQGQPTHKHKSGKPLKAIRARLRGKEGRLRGNLMGKRVDFSSRSVITPDPILRLDQLGVPVQIALNLTVPETVTCENIDEMKNLVQNGPNTWPGARYIVRPDGLRLDIQELRNRSDAHIEPGYQVERHLKNDDYVIFNRQPSLHKMSLMGHRVKVLPYSTFRLNLSVTTPYNADFDGDEMNMHVPQSYETTAEIKEIMAVPNQIVSPKDNKPVMGIVQDALLGIMLFTLRDTFIDKELVMNLLMWANYEDDKFPAPAILRPKPLWTGKQIFSLIIPQINLERVGNKDTWACAGDKNILIKNGELLCGNLNKSTIGSSSGGMIHIIWKEKGPYPTRDFMSNTQLLINNWLHQTGFTVGVQDIIARKITLDKIKVDLRVKNKEVKGILYQAQVGNLQQQPGKNMIDSLEFEVNKALNKARDEAGETALKDLFMWNRLKAMVTAGSKGSNLNISQIMACVGQQNVEGKRIPFGFSQRTLPHFSKDDFGPESKGFVKNCYLTGLTPQEFFFHAMGGREGLIDTAVKTAETGYIQRRLIKALEDVMVKYDGTVRTSKEQVIQFLYGEDGFGAEFVEDLKIGLYTYDNKALEIKCRFLPPEKSTVEHEKMLSNSVEPKMAKDIANDPQITLKLNNEFNQLLQDREDLRSIILKKQGDEEIHIPVNVPRIIWNAKEQFKIKQHSKSDLHPSYVLMKLQNLFDDLSTIPGIQVRQDPLILQARENSTWLFKIYLRSMLCTKAMIQLERFSIEAFDWVIGEIKSRFEQAIVNPGEMVGPIAAQSLGEPATQMTLNTFHNAGISSKNVTLGVPRLKEIINVAKNIKTPSLKIYLQKEYRKDEKVAQKLLSQIEHTTLNKVVKSSQIYYDPDPEKTVIREDQDLIDLYNEMPDPDNIVPQGQRIPPWVLRLVFDREIIIPREIQLSDIYKKLRENFTDQIQIMKSDDNAVPLVMRLRFYNLLDDDGDEEETACTYLKEIMDKLLNQQAISGIPEISKVTFTKYEEGEWSQETGAFQYEMIEKWVENDKKFVKEKQKYWLIETDGVALQHVLGIKKVDHKRVVSNDIQEILRVLGIEAVRLSLINELRFVLGSYGIYVNYRHLSTLCDVMTQRGILTSITRHGINRVDTGPLRKCSFEETVEILYEAAVFAETDYLSGITENIIMGQLAPYGTGSFDLVVDKEVLSEFAQAKAEDDGIDAIGYTPIQDQDGGYIVDTPLQLNTPSGDFGGGRSEYSMGVGTPGYQGNMSPSYNVGIGGASPQYGIKSPGYGASSPGYKPGQSPIYGPSPIYSKATPGMMSPSHSGSIQQQSMSSPKYSPTQTNQSPGYASGSYKSPAYPSGGHVYSGGLPSQSPAYLSSSNARSGQSPTYSPTSYKPQMSPGYSPTTPNYNRAPAGGQSYSPSYSPTQTVGGGGYSQSPKYQPSVISSSPNRGSYGGSVLPVSSHHSPGSPSASAAYIPQSPVYNPASVGYQAPIQGAGVAAARPSYIGGSPIDSSPSQTPMNNEGEDRYSPDESDEGNNK